MVDPEGLSAAGATVARGVDPPSDERAAAVAIDPVGDTSAVGCPALDSLTAIAPALEVPPVRGARERSGQSGDSLTVLAPCFSKDAGGNAEEGSDGETVDPATLRAVGLPAYSVGRPARRSGESKDARPACAGAVEAPSVIRA